MGEHFDRLVDIVRSLDDDNVEYLTSILHQATLFDLPVHSNEIRPTCGKEEAEYHQYLKEQIEINLEHGSYVITPYPITAVEDKDSVVILEPLDTREFRVIDCKPEGVLVGDVNFGRHVSDKRIECVVNPLYAMVNGVNVPESNFGLVGKDLIQSAISYVEEVIYIMDPENFIIERESNASKKMRAKGKNKKINKTIMRPHYICLSEQDLTSFLKGESSEPRPAHPVRGHWRRFHSERFVNMKGKQTYIAQYFTGEGKVAGRNGIHYEVRIKKEHGYVSV